MYLILGATGGIGAALSEIFEAAGHQVMRAGRNLSLNFDLLDERSIAALAQSIGPDLDVVVDATGFLHNAEVRPEKSLSQIRPEALALNFALNATGPALLMKHFLPLLARDRKSVFASLSARVGSISDNHLGGWYGYRASKAALNQLIRTASIELARTNPYAICVALHPGTVATNLSDPFAKSGLAVQTPAAAAARLCRVIDDLTSGQSGCLIDQNGALIPF